MTTMVRAASGRQPPKSAIVMARASGPSARSIWPGRYAKGAPGVRTPLLRDGFAMGCRGSGLGSVRESRFQPAPPPNHPIQRHPVGWLGGGAGRHRTETSPFRDVSKKAPHPGHERGRRDAMPDGPSCAWSAAGNRPEGRQVRAKAPGGDGLYVGALGLYTMKGLYRRSGVVSGAFPEWT